MTHTVVLVEDEPAIADNYREALTSFGYSVVVYHNEPDARAALQGELPDLVILDIELGENALGGFTLCKMLTDRSRTLPVIFLTARDDHSYEELGLELGAHDYLRKDTSLKSLRLRVERLLASAPKAGESAATEPERHVGAFSLNEDGMRVWWHGEPVSISMTEFQLLEALTRRPGNIFTRDQLMDIAGLTIEPQSIDSHMKRIRKKFRAINTDEDPIKAERGMGYRWNTELL